MAYVWCICNECGETNEIKFDGDNPAHCPDCRSLDCFTEIEDELCFTCNGSGEGYTDGSRCSSCKGSGSFKYKGEE